MLPIFKPDLGKTELAELEESFSTGWIGLGPKTKKFEEAFKDYIGCKHAISLNSCTSALHLALMASHVEEGDEIAISSMTFASTGHAVLFCGAVPILVDIDPETLQMDPEDLVKKLSSKTKAVIAVHYGGHICDMDPILKISRKHNLSVIEDAANCAGASYKGRKIGNLDSDFSCFSFEAKKNMTTGDGGMITHNKDDSTNDRIRRMRWVGMDKDTVNRFSQNAKPWEYDILELGYKYNMNDIAAGIGLAQLRKLDHMNMKRNRVVSLYNEAFKNVPWLQTPIDKEYSQNTYWLYILRLNDGNRDEMMYHLLNNGILANTSFRPLHLFTFYRNYFKELEIDVNCPTAEREWNRLFVLPLFPDMTEAEVDKVIESVKAFGRAGC